MKNAVKDILKRLWTLLVIFVLLTQLASLVSKKIPDKTVLEWHGITGEILYQYSLAEHQKAYILHDQQAGTVFFAVVNGERLGGYRQMPFFRDVEYASEVRLADLEVLWWLHMGVNESKSDVLYITEQHMYRMNHANTEVKYLARGMTTEPDRLEGKNVLFQTEIGGVTVFCLEADEPRTMRIEENIRQDIS